MSATGLVTSVRHCRWDREWPVGKRAAGPDGRPLRLSSDSSDVVCAREGYSLLKKLRSGGEFTPRARVEPWTHGVDTLRAFVAFANVGKETAAVASASSQPSAGEGVWPEVHTLLAAGSTTGVIELAPCPVEEASFGIDGVGDAAVAATASRVRQEVTYGWM